MHDITKKQSGGLQVGFQTISVIQRSLGAKHRSASIFIQNLGKEMCGHVLSQRPRYLASRNSKNCDRRLSTTVWSPDGIEE